MKQSEIIEEFGKVPDIRILLLTHPDSEMVKASCLHYLGDKAQGWYHNQDAQRYPVLYFEKNTDRKFGFAMKHMSSDVELLEVSWKTVFNTGLKSTHWNGIDHAAEVAKEYGFKFFTWNGWVYSIEYGQTDFRTDQLDGNG